MGEKIIQRIYERKQESKKKRKIAFLRWEFIKENKKQELDQANKKKKKENTP